MSPCPLTSQPNPLVCLRLLCLLLLLTDSSSSTAPEGVAAPTGPPATTQANYSTACHGGDVGENATNVSCKTIDVQTMPLQKNLSSIADSGNAGQNFGVNGAQSSSSSSTNTSVGSKLTGPVPTVIPRNQSAGGNPSPEAPPSDQHPDSPDNRLPLPENGTQPAALLLPNTTGLFTQAAQTGSITSTGDARPDVNTTAVLVTSTATPTPTTTTTTTRPTTTTPTTTTTTTTPTTTTSMSTTTTTTAAPHPATTIKAKSTLPSANTTVTTTTGPKMTPPPSPVTTPQPHAPSTGMPPVHTQTVASATPPPAKEPVGSGTVVAMVEAAGGALTRQLVDTASLLAILLFGLLFFMVTVSVFVTQAYKSYRRKDYTQVDYLINGMYTDSGV